MFGIDQKKAISPLATEKPNVKPVVKGDNICEIEGCWDVKAPGQNHVCTKHVRSN